jgi:hypothetical protein
MNAITPAKTAPSPTAHAPPLDCGDEVVAGRARPSANQTENGDRVQTIEKIAVDLQEIREQERDGEREDETPGQPGLVMRDSEPHADTTLRPAAQCMRSHHSSFPLLPR